MRLLCNIAPNGCNLEMLAQNWVVVVGCVALAFDTLQCMKGEKDMGRGPVVYMYWTHSAVGRLAKALAWFIHHELKVRTKVGIRTQFDLLFPYYTEKILEDRHTTEQFLDLISRTQPSVDLSTFNNRLLQRGDKAQRNSEHSAFTSMMRAVYDTRSSITVVKDRTRSFPKHVWTKALKLYGNQCFYCKNILTKLTGQVPDHRIPHSLGGKSDLENCRPSCVHCNLRKGSMSEDDFITLLLEQAKMMSRT